MGKEAKGAMRRRQRRQKRAGRGEEERVCEGYPFEGTKQATNERTKPTPTDWLRGSQAGKQLCNQQYERIRSEPNKKSCCRYTRSLTHSFIRRRLGHLNIYLIDDDDFGDIHKDRYTITFSTS